MKIGIVGFATEGMVSAAYFARQGHAVTVCDQATDLTVPPEYATQLGSGYLDNLAQFDVVVRSAGIPPHVLLEHNPGIESKITTAVDEFLRVCPTPNVIGITGTKGKGTTSTLTTKMLEAAGLTVWLGGNIGRSPLEFIDQVQPDDWVVLELSSFQLCDVRHSPHIALCLMVVPEHLNWHTDMDDYIAAKTRLFAQQNSSDIAIFYAHNDISKAIAGDGAGRKIPYYESPGAWVNGNMVTIDGEEICTTDELRLLGKHNWQNVCAAATATWHALNPASPAQVRAAVAAIRSVATSFTGLPNRLELVRERENVRYYNDSFASTPDAALAALEAIASKKVLVMGGLDRGLPLDHVPKTFLEYADDLRIVLLIGASAQRLYTVCAEAGFTNCRIVDAKNMSEIVSAIQDTVQPGDAVVFSPGFASFDMFKNFEERGNLFRDTVNAL
jgi:UDP-N-acetylmuramoylalanine--D-glutamate ligase